MFSNYKNISSWGYGIFISAASIKKSLFITKTSRSLPLGAFCKRLHHNWTPVSSWSATVPHLAFLGCRISSLASILLSSLEAIGSGRLFWPASFQNLPDTVGKDDLGSAGSCCYNRKKQLWLNQGFRWDLPFQVHPCT